MTVLSAAPSGGSAIRRLRWIAVTLSLGALVAGCGSDGEAEPSSATGSTSTAPAIDGTFVVDGKQRRLALRCWGDGTPTVVFDAGSGDAGISAFQHSSYVRELVARTRVCLYDRAGVGLSDPAPARKRLLDDAADDLHELLVAADVPGPYVLVGSSGGGFNVYHHAGRYPDEVVGLVLLDVPAGQADLTEADIGAWNGPENPEHMDYVAIERQMALDRLPIPSIPVTVVTARAGQSADPKEQRVWLEGSSKPVQLVLDGGHEIYQDDPAGVLDAIVGVLEASKETR
jgi:pimeloyl-ACP methyl ester carboxylesterase